MKASTVRLADVCEFIRGVTFDKAEVSNYPGKGKTSILRAGNISDQLDVQNDLIWVPDDIVGDEQKFRKNDIAICMSSGSPEVVGKTARVSANMHASIGSFCGIIRPKNPDEASFLSFYFRSSAFKRHRDKIARGANIQNLRFSSFEEIELIIPSEQSAIAQQLEQADRFRRLHRYALKMSESFLQAMFIDIFGDLKGRASVYEQMAFGEIAASTQLGVVRGAAEMNDSYPYEYLRMDSIVGDGTLNVNRLKRVKATDKEVKDFSLQSGDFLFNTRNSKELVGKTALYVGRHRALLFNNNIMRIRFKPMVTPEFMIGLFQSPWLKQNLERLKSGTTSVFAIYYKDLSDLPILVPPLPMQKRFVDVVMAQARLRAMQVESLRQAEHLFQSLLHQAFNEN